MTASCWLAGCQRLHNSDACCSRSWFLRLLLCLLSSQEPHGTLQGSARHPEAKGKGWVLKKKEQARQRGYSNIPADTKYTGRKRKSRF